MKKRLEKTGDLETFYQLSSKQQKAIELLFEGNLKNTDIASNLRISESTFYDWKNLDIFVKARKEYSHYYLGNAAVKAVKTMTELLKSDSDMVRFNAAKDILDRDGFAPVEKQEVTHTNPIVISSTLNDGEENIQVDD